MSIHEKWDIFLRIVFGVIAALFTVFVFSVGETQKAANNASAVNSNAHAQLALVQASELETRRTDAIERTSILGAEALVRAYVDSDQVLACNAFLALSAVAAGAHEDGLEELPKQVNAILSARPTFANECKVANPGNSGATSESFDIAEFRIETAAQERNTTTSTNAEWYAVALSLRVSTPNALARAFAYADQLENSAAALDSTFSIQVWRTSISDHYTVTVGGPSEKDDAERIAAVLRTSGLVPDAFAQDDRNWTEQERNGALAVGMSPQTFAGFRLFFHIPETVDRRALRIQLVSLFEERGASIGGFDNQVDQFGVGVDFTESSSEGRRAAGEVADVLNETLSKPFGLETMSIRPQSALNNDRILGVWINLAN